MSAFSSVTSFPLKRIVIQFWRPVKSPHGYMLLSCVGYPYAISPVNRLLSKYRSGCVKYLYSIGDHDHVVDVPLTIGDAPPSHAVVNLSTEVVLDLRAHRGTPLVDLALECELNCFFMMPVFDETQCVGVIEVSMRHPAGLVVIFNELKHGLKGTGLSITPPKSLYWPMSPPVGINLEIKEAIGVPLHAHGITLGQVWCRHESLYPDPPGINIRTFLRRLEAHALGDPLDHPVTRFYDGMVVIPFVNAKGLVRRTLETHRPYFSRNIYNLSENSEGVLALLSANAMCASASFVICLRSHHTGVHTNYTNYAFEFFWPQTANHLALMEGLLLTLREYLPSFRYASGAQLGGELLVVDVDNSSRGSESTTIRIFPGNKISKIPNKALKETRALVGMKRMYVDFHDGQSELNQANQHALTNINNPEDHDDDDDLVILAVYKVHCRLFFLPSSTTFQNVMDKIKQEFGHELNSVVTYKVGYQVLPGKWYNLTDGTCLKRCISSYQASKNIDHIKFYVFEK